MAGQPIRSGRQRPVTIAVIDSGISDHPEVDGVVTAVYDADPGEDPDPLGTHGTAMAGLIAANDDGVGITGLVDDTDVLSSTVNERAGLLQGFQVVSLLPDHIRWAVDQGADVINMSFHAKCAFGFPFDCAHEQTGEAIRYARQHGVVVVASGGNRGEEGSPLQWPAGFDGVIAVSNHDRDGRRHPTSTANENIDLSAPGTDVLVAGLGTDESPASCRGGYTDGEDAWWCVVTGASPSAAFVSATAGWLKAMYPDATPEQIERALLDGARLPDGQEAGERSDEFGYGFLDPLAAADLMLERATSRQLVAYSSGQRLSVADLAAGERLRLWETTRGNEGVPTNPLHWTRDGRYLGGLSGAAGTVRIWDTDGFDFDAADAPEPMLEIDAGSDRGCISDFVFSDDSSTVTVLESFGTQEHAVSCLVSAPLQLRHYDIGSQRAGEPIDLTSPVSELIGYLPGDDTMVSTAWNQDDGYSMVWLGRDGSELRAAELPADGTPVAGPVLSGDGGRVALALGSVADGATDLFTVDTASGEVTEVPMPETAFGRLPVELDDFRWTSAVGGGLMVTHETNGVLVHADGAWHQVDADPVRAARAVGYRTQVVLTSGSSGSAGDLYVLHRRPYGESGDVYDEPAGEDEPLARDVNRIWFRPSELGERPFVVD